MASGPQLTKAILIPMNGDQPETDQAQHIIVQFNPTSLRVQLSNTVNADNSGGGTPTPAQYIEKSESTLTVQLVFDTTVAGDASIAQGDAGADATQTTSTQPRPAQGYHRANSDVRLLTRAVAETFMKPQNPDSERPTAPKRCRFQWGAFVFVGMVSSYGETLDFFSPEGVPLRATLALTLKEDRYQFETRDVPVDERNPPVFAAGGDNISAASAAAGAGKNPGDWRDLALFNGLENPRLSASVGLSIPGVSLVASLGANSSVGAGIGVAAGFSAGASASLGTSIPGAFSLETSSSKNKGKKSALPGASALAGASLSSGSASNTSASSGVDKPRATIQVSGPQITIEG